MSKIYGRTAAVSDVALRVPARSVYGFLGPNGAGKTTTIRMLLGLIRPTTGRAVVFGHDVARQRGVTAAMIGSMVEAPALYERLTGRENLEVARLLTGAGREEVDRVLEVVELTAAAGKIAKTYSQGMKQRLGLARALLGGPRLLILDEPTNGLDPEGIRAFRELIRALPARQDVTVFVSSHLLAEVEEIASHIGILDKGRLVMQGDMAALKQQSQRTASISVQDSAEAAKLLAAKGMKCEIRDAETVVLEVAGSAPPRDVLTDINRYLVENGCVPFEIRMLRTTLEDLYMLRGPQGGQ
ncbi:MAG TPA: ABC transporter ATP-binding protein [Asticcacaulis sp.]|nr:ABC transporter ATP-binding protein [Asticcacaulis sp.]